MFTKIPGDERGVSGKSRNKEERNNRGLKMIKALKEEGIMAVETVGRKTLQRLKQQTANRKSAVMWKQESTGGLTEEGREMGCGCFLLSILISAHTLRLARTHTHLALTV